MSESMEQMNRPAEPAGVEVRPDSSLHRELGAWARDLVIAAALAAVIIVFFYQPVKVEGTSMAPLLSDQERIFINKFVYHVGEIRRGDIVVFWYPMDMSKSFIKRVVGLPGDLVEMRQGHVYLNGKELEEPYVPAEYMDAADYAPVPVQPGEYFVMGDHRSSSNDSRMFGPVAAKYIYGKAVFAYWPIEQFGGLSKDALKSAQPAPVR
jgi:signal peptidase I